ncbi:hypothetical protein [cf. Phormidesmis sp. LEGE 11477]|uniref:hypothetical protein n=1 Tax=cf. Phormidesmis sp. LEGE 11477 TaxID=1828680 RepID=UPI00187DE5C2|nr:hypothetical protein [cf. Phormidesmis sp. LEGE 11477]
MAAQLHLLPIAVIAALAAGSSSTATRTGAIGGGDRSVDGLKQRRSHWFNSDSERGRLLFSIISITDSC